MTPTSNHNLQYHNSLSFVLYIFWLLHQTTTCGIRFWFKICCISFDSYIKPQPEAKNWYWLRVVYLLTPTSNHNNPACIICSTTLYIFWLLHQTTTTSVSPLPSTRCISFDSYIKPQRDCWCRKPVRVVYLLTPTSNHNSTELPNFSSGLYIFWLLHQTTTNGWNVTAIDSCISFDSYIKPQPLSCRLLVWCVVYLLTPTSNHN